MKTKHIFFYFFLSLSLFSLAMPKTVWGQCNANFNQSDPVCVPYCATGNCNTTTVSITCTNIQSPQWSAIGGVEVVSSSASGNTYSAVIRSKTGSFCKGRVFIRWIAQGSACSTQYAVENVRSLDVFKSFSKTDLDNAYAGIPNLGSPFRVVGNTPPCVQPDGVYTFSVKGLHQCIADEIGIDDIVWSYPNQWTLVYQSNDQSSVTLKAPPSATLAGTTNITARLGRCNATWQGSLTLNRAASNPWISVSQNGGLFSNLDQGATQPNARGCLPANTTTSFRLRCNPDETGFGYGYTWVVPPTVYTFTTIAANEIEVTPKAGTQGASATITCTVNAGQCGQKTASFAITRSLVSGYNVINSSATTNCYYPETSYTFTLTNLPQNTTVNWGPTTAGSNPYWEILSGQGTGSITARPVIPTGSTATSLDLTVNAPYTGFTPAQCGATLTLPCTLANSPVALKVLKNGSIFTVVRESNNSSNDWYTEFGCPQNQIVYEWKFTGTYQAQASPFTPPCTTTVVQSCTTGCTPASFNTPILGTGQSVQLLEGCYSGTLEVVVRNAAACSNCRYTKLTFTMGTVPRPGHPGSSDPVSSVEILPPPALLLHPNPSPGQVEVELKNISEKGVLRVRNANGQVLNATEMGESRKKIRIGRLPAGLYLVEYVAENGQLITERLVIE